MVSLKAKSGRLYIINLIYVIKICAIDSWIQMSWCVLKWRKKSWLGRRKVTTWSDLAKADRCARESSLEEVLMFSPSVIPETRQWLRPCVTILQNSDGVGGGTSSCPNEALKHGKSTRFYGLFTQTHKKPGATVTTVKWRQRRQRNHLQSMNWIATSTGPAENLMLVCGTLWRAQRKKK